MVQHKSEKSKKKSAFIQTNKITVQYNYAQHIRDH